MARPLKIGADEALKRLPGWRPPTTGRDYIQRAYLFKDFITAITFMMRVAFMAEKLDHHPEWHNVYSLVNVTLTTHDADGVTELDVVLASHMDIVAKEMGAMNEEREPIE